MIYDKQKLDSHYLNIYKQNEEKLIQGGIGDKYLQSAENDTRMSLVLLIRIDSSIRQNIVEYLTQIKRIEPNLYFYPESDFHVTVMDILKGMPNRSIPDNIQNYISCIQKCVNEIKPFEIEFNGLTASDNAVMVKGYYEKNMKVLRQLLRNELKKERLLLEERYETFSSHITVIRIPTKLQNPNKFIQYIKSPKLFGTMTVNSLELVFHNWYDSKKELLSMFTI